MAANFLERTWFSPSWTNEEVSLTLEVIHNGDLIDWGYWVDLSNITPAQAARLHWAIDPIKWPSNDYGLGVLPDDLQRKIQRLEQWLESRASTWSLHDLVVALGGDNAPAGMVEAVKDRNQLKQAEVGIANDIYWNDWLNREQFKERTPIQDYIECLINGEELCWQLAKKLSELNGWPLDSGQFYYAEKEYRNTIEQAWRSGNIQGIGRLTFTIQSPDSTIFEDVSFKTADIERLLNCKLGFLWGVEHELVFNYINRLLY